MYKFMLGRFGACIVACRHAKELSGRHVQVVELETYHGFSRITSRYSHEQVSAGGEADANLSEVTLCRYAVGQFLRRNEIFHKARVEILDITGPKFRGTATAISSGRTAIAAGVPSSPEKFWAREARNAPR